MPTTRTVNPRRLSRKGLLRLRGGASVVSIAPGSPLGLLLALTFSAPPAPSTASRILLPSGSGILLPSGDRIISHG